MELCAEGIQCSTEILGQSYEGRDLEVFRVCNLRSVASHTREVDLKGI